MRSLLVGDIAGSSTLQVVSARLESATGLAACQDSNDSGYPVADVSIVEAAVTLLYLLGEGAPEDAFKPGSGRLARMAAGI